MIADSRFYKYEQLRTDRHVEACRWNNLVYVRTLKCGSEFFYKNFTITAGWVPITWQDINWDQDTVFSYIMDPVVRRNKGVSEYLVAQGAQDLILNNATFGQVIAQVPCFDEHSACLRDLYGEYLHKINWIPMDNQNHQLSIDITNKLLAEHNCPEIKWNQSFKHTTANYLDKIHARVTELWHADASVQQITLFYFKEDIELFTQTLGKYASPV